MLQSLHGQSKDALAKTKVGAWEYDVAFPEYEVLAWASNNLNVAHARFVYGFLCPRQ